MFRSVWIHHQLDIAGRCNEQNHTKQNQKQKQQYYNNNHLQIQSNQNKHVHHSDNQIDNQQSNILQLRRTVELSIDNDVCHNQIPNNQLSSTQLTSAHRFLPFR